MSGWGSKFSSLCDWEVGGLIGRWRVNTQWEESPTFSGGPLGALLNGSLHLCAFWLNRVEAP